MKVYIATRLENTAQHNELRDQLKMFGIGLTYDWTVHGSVKHDAERITGVAEYELAGVRDADVVIGLLPGGRGMHAELGGAVILGKPVALFTTVPAHFEHGSETCAFYWARSVFLRTLNFNELAPAVVFRVHALVRGRTENL